MPNENELDENQSKASEDTVIDSARVCVEIPELKDHSFKQIENHLQHTHEHVENTIARHGVNLLRQERLGVVQDSRQVAKE